MTGDATTERRYVTEAEAARLLGLATITLQTWRLAGKGKAPRHARFGRAVRYDVRDLDAWASAQKVA